MVYKVLSNIKHNGHIYAVNDSIELADDEAKKLIADNIVEQVTEQKEADAVAPDGFPQRPTETNTAAPETVTTATANSETVTTATTIEATGDAPTIEQVQQDIAAIEEDNSGTVFIS